MWFWIRRHLHEYLTLGEVNATTAILNIMASNYRSEFHFTPAPIIPTPLLLIFGKVSNPPIIPNLPLLGTLE